MFDPELLETNSVAREGLKLLAQSGIIESQQTALKERLAAGNVNETDESILASIREFRRQYGVLESLLELGLGCIKESEK